jgi:HTH-type transcriptional regulator/antitoxin HigA
MPGAGAEPVRHPGWVISDWLAENGHMQVNLARELGITPKHLNQILRGHALWSVELAARIERRTGISARTLMALKAEYLLDQQRKDRHK